MKQGGKNGEDLPLALSSDADCAKSLLSCFEFLDIVDTFDDLGAWTSVLEIVEVRELLVEAKGSTVRLRSAGEQLVEDVVVALGFSLMHQS